MSSVRLRIGSLVLLSSLALTACKKDAVEPSGGAQGADAGTTMPGADASISTGGSDASVPSVARLRIEPENPTVVVTDGVASLVDFRLIAIDQQGGERAVADSMIWRTDRDEIARFVDETRPQLTVSGERAGAAVVEVVYSGLRAMTTVSVRLVWSQLEIGVPNGAPAMFGGTVSRDPAMSPAIVYPTTEVVIPKNLVPMTVQWDAPAKLDLFRVKLETPLASADVYTTAREARLVKERWSKILESAAPGPITVEIAGVSMAAPSTVFTSPPVRILVADALMRGTIYYWALNIGRILRIRPGEEAYEDFFTPPADTQTGSTCVGCHTLSRDGSKMAFEYYGGWRSHGVVNTIAPTPPLIAPDVFPANFSAFDGTGNRLVGVLSGVLTIRDANTGAAIEDLQTAAATHPAWSPDGNTIAYVSQVAGQAFNDIDFFQSDLSVIREVNGTRGAPEVLVPADGMANTYPSFSPDSRLIAYGRGPWSRSHTNYDPANVSAVSPGNIHLVPIDRSVPPVELSRASRGQAYLPAFSPFEGGGYTWIAFFSRRDYGNVTKGTARRQIWVTGIDQRMPAGTDRSQVAFWLPAQDPSTENMSAYWAPDPCHATGSVCVLDEDCCGGSVCRDDGTGTRRCISREDVCREIGEPCADVSECCPGTRIDCVTTGEGPRCQQTDL